MRVRIDRPTGLVRLEGRLDEHTVAGTRLHRVLHLDVPPAIG